MQNPLSWLTQQSDQWFPTDSCIHTVNYCTLPWVSSVLAWSVTSHLGEARAVYSCRLWFDEASLPFLLLTVMQINNVKSPSFNPIQSKCVGSAVVFLLLERWRLLRGHAACVLNTCFKLRFVDFGAEPSEYHLRGIVSWQWYDRAPLPSRLAWCWLFSCGFLQVAFARRIFHGLSSRMVHTYYKTNCRCNLNST